MKYHPSFVLVTALAVVLIAASDATAAIASGVSLNFDANDPASAIDAANWNSTKNVVGHNFDFGGDVTLEAVTSSRGGISQAYRFTGGNGDNNQPAWDNLFGDGNAASWEFWLKPADTGDAGQVIFEAGGSGTGFAIWYAPGTIGDNSGTLNFTIDGGTASGTHIETVSATIGTTEFRQITLLYDKDHSGTIDLLAIYVDGQFVDDNLSATVSDDAGNDNDNTGIDDFSGGDPAGLGNASGATNAAGNIAQTVVNGEFEGDISIYRVWGGKTLSASEISDNYDAVVSDSSVTVGADFQVDASADTDGDQRWEDLTPGNPTGHEILLDSSPAVTRVAVSGSIMPFTHAYDFPGGSTGNQAGGLFVDTGTSTQQSFEASSNGDWSTNSVTLEFWVKPDNLTPGPTNGQVIFESGGGIGLGILVDNNELVVTHDNGSPQITYNLNTDPSGVLAAAATSEFFQIVVTQDTTTPFQTILYINGQQVGTTNDDGDWSGSDGTGFGTRGGSNLGGLGGGQQSTESFDGQIALIRAYFNQILTPAEVEANYESVLTPGVVILLY